MGGVFGDQRDIWVENDTQSYWSVAIRQTSKFESGEFYGINPGQRDKWRRDIDCPIDITISSNGKAATFSVRYTGSTFLISELVKSHCANIFIINLDFRLAVEITNSTTLVINN